MIRKTRSCRVLQTNIHPFQKNCSSTAFANGMAFVRLLSVPEFEKIMKSGPEKSIQLVIFITVDGGPDENSVYKKVNVVSGSSLFE